MLKEKEDLRRTLIMFENLNRDHRIAIAASIDAYRREETMQRAERVTGITGSIERKMVVNG